jgi:hypothetical protein
MSDKLVFDTKKMKFRSEKISESRRYYLQLLEKKKTKNL